MSTQHIIIIVIVGLIGGVMSGGFGVGGGIIIIPTLIIALGLSQHEAQGAFIGMAVFPVQIFSAWSYFKHGNLDWQIALIMLVTFTAGSFIGAHITNTFIPDDTLKKGFGLLLLFTSIKLIFF
ncbi:MAG: TSUP family transporter [Bacteroidota bacterium]|nr:TSUP family transporter [Bacteroidota bacterium]